MTTRIILLIVSIACGALIASNVSLRQTIERQAARITEAADRGCFVERASPVHFDGIDFRKVKLIVSGPEGCASKEEGTLDLIDLKTGEVIGGSIEEPKP